jgi:hypothetical protein
MTFIALCFLKSIIVVSLIGILIILIYLFLDFLRQLDENNYF